MVDSNNPGQVFGPGGDDDIELDAVFASGSADVGDGGEGRDCIDGGGGADLMIGGPGDDNRPCEFTAFVDPQAALTGGPGDDRIEGGPGDDTMNGIFDNDTLIGGTGNDLLPTPRLATGTTCSSTASESSASGRAFSGGRPASPSPT
jgi:Ca2+-binding RTX toxin-like protein